MIPRGVVGRLQEAARSGELDELCARRRVRLLVAFGSAARGSEDARDLDLAVAFEPDADRDILALIQELAVVTGTARIDLMDLDAAEPIARERALVGTVPLYESLPGGFATAQIAAMLERMDTAWLRRLDLEAMAGKEPAPAGGDAAGRMATEPTSAGGETVP